MLGSSVQMKFGWGALSSMPVGIAVVGMLACRPPSSEIPLDELGHEDPGTTQGETRDSIEPLAVERPTDLLPAEVAVLAEAIRPAALLELLGPLDRYPDFARARDELRAGIGGDILDPSQWSTLGLDSEGPAGIGLLDASSGAFFAYVSLVDEQRFEQTLLRFSDLAQVRESLATTTVGDARVYRLAPEVSVVVREGVALMMMVSDPEQAPRDYVVSAATIDPRESLGHSERFGWARDQILSVDDGLLFINPAELIHQWDQNRSDDYGVRYAEEELARARARGDAPAVVAELEDRVAEERRWQQERDARAAGGRELVNQLFGSITAVVGAADLSRDGINAHGQMAMPGTNLLRRMLLPVERESPILTALGEAPLFVVDGRVDLQVLLEAVDLFARADGESLEHINTKVLDELGIDVLGRLIPALSGEGGVAITQTRAPDPKRLSEVPKSVGLAAYAGLRDPDAIRAVFDVLVRDKRIGGALVRAKRGDGWTLAVPEWRDVDVRIVADRLVLSTDSKFAGRVRDAERGSVAAELTATHPLQGPIANPSARLYAKWSGAMVLDAREPWTQDAESMVYDINSHGILSPEEAAEVPKSKAYKRKLAQLEKAAAAMDAYSLVRAQRAFERDLEFADRLGDAGWQFEALPDGVGMTAQWRFTPGVTPIEVGMTMLMGGSDEDWTEYERLSTEVSVALDELRVIRQADLDAAAAKRP